MIYYNANIHTRDSAMAVKDGRIIAVGSDTEIFEHFGSDQPKIDLKHKRVLPGFIESHGHFIGVGNIRKQLELTGTTSENEIIGLVAKKASQTKPGVWIKGRGWDQNDWVNTAFPNNRALSEASPNHPVVLTRIDGHAIWCNRMALQIAGVDLDSAILIDHAMALVTKHIPKATHEELIDAARVAAQESLRLGITSFHDASTDQNTIEAYQALLQSGTPMPRLYVMLDGADSELLKRYYQSGPVIDDHLSIRSVKFYADGALGSRGAALLEPYQDDPSNFGLSLYSLEELTRLTHQATLHGFQVATHAIGDRTNRLVLDAYKGIPNDARLRIEHAQIVQPDDILRFAKQGVIASVQPTHYVSDLPWASQRLGDVRTQQAGYPWRSFLDNGAYLAAGSDAPIESLNPLLGIHAAVTREDPLERLTLAQAIDAFTMAGAYAEFQEHQKGRLAPGYLADFMVLSDDIFAMPVREIPNIQVEMTVLGGTHAFTRSD